MRGAVRHFMGWSDILSVTGTGCAAVGRTAGPGVCHQAERSPFPSGGAATLTAIAGLPVRW